jgi:hypothetical protein
LLEKGYSWEFSPISPSWHPEFELEKLTPIPLAELPIKKVVANYSLEKPKIHASELLQKLKSTHSFSKVEASSASAIVEESPPIENGDKPKVSRSKALLERIREKERLRKEQDAAKPKDSPELIKRKSMMQRLVPISSSLHMFAKGKGKTVLPVPSAIGHLQQSFQDYFFSSGMKY